MSFKFEKTKQMIEILVQGQDAFTAHVFLADFCPNHHGSERVLDLLKGDDQHMPILNKDDKVILVNKSTIKSVLVDSDFELEIFRSYGPDGLTTKPVKAQFVDGNVLEGQLIVEQVEGYARALDELNRNSTFIPIIQGEKVNIIGLNYVAWIEEVE